MGTWEKVASELMDHKEFGGQITQKSRFKKTWTAVQPLLAAAATPEAKIKAIYGFVQSSFEREDGHSIYVRQNLDDLFEKKSARSSEMNLLLTALLREAGVKAHPVLISTRDHGQAVPQYPIMDQFNHVLVLAEAGEKSMLLEAGNPFRPAGLVGVHSLNKEGWIVNPDNPQWIEITPSLAAEIFFGAFHLDETGNLSGKMQVQADGYDAVSHRDKLSRNSAAEFWKSQLQKRYPDAGVDSLQVEGQGNPETPVKESFWCTLPSYAQVSGDFIYLTPAFFSHFNENKFKLEQRNYPVDIPYPFKERIIFDLSVPSGYRVESLPEPTRLVLPNNGARFQYNIESKEGKVLFNCNLQVNQLHFEPEEYDQLRSFFGMVAEKLGEQVVLKRM
jgi:hypothetical protein